MRLSMLFLLALGFSGCVSAQAGIPSAETLLILTLAGEARNQGEEGMRAVASVIHHRALADRTRNIRGAQVPSPAALLHEILTPRRYSVWRWGRYTQSFDGAPDRVALYVAAVIATEMLNGSFRPEIRADHYHAIYVKPVWQHKMRRVAQVGTHVFYWSK